jgi:hypothetical protein
MVWRFFYFIFYIFSVFFSLFNNWCWNFACLLRCHLNDFVGSLFKSVPLLFCLWVDLKRLWLIMLTFYMHKVSCLLNSRLKVVSNCIENIAKKLSWCYHRLFYVSRVVDWHFFKIRIIFLDHQFYWRHFHSLSISHH